MVSAQRPPIVSLRSVTKRFGGAAALSGVSLDISSAQVHGLVGANGAGKSTLGRVIGGIHSHDEGALIIDGHQVSHWTPRTALNVGIAMIQQELALVPALSVAENVFLGIESSHRGFLKDDNVARFRALEERCKLGLDPHTPVRDLRIAERQKVEIMRALARDARLIIMDEPTSALTRNEADNLHATIRRLRSEGAAVVYVSHYLDMVLEISDTVTVMRNGEVVRTSPAAAESPESLVEAMTGAALELAFPPRPPRPAATAPVVLRVEHLSAGTAVTDVSLEVRAGEIVGIAGLVGSGRSELLRAIFGADHITEGTVQIGEASLSQSSPQASSRLGLAMIPEDRRNQGLVMTMEVSPNVTLPHLGAVSRFGVIELREERRRVGDLLRTTGVQPPLTNGDVRTFSGGNQQKILFSKWLFGSPRAMLLDEPTRGVDIASKRAIYNEIVGMAARGIGVLLVSSEFEEVLGLAHRVHVMHRGRFVNEFEPASIDHDGLMRAAFNLEPETLSRSAI